MRLRQPEIGISTVSSVYQIPASIKDQGKHQAGGWKTQLPVCAPDTWSWSVYGGATSEEEWAKKRAITSTAVKVFMDSIKKELGDFTFDTFMSVNGDVTLMFAIDDTGSMHDEIQAAKDIATSIVNHPRDEAVDYILSPFNDPG